MIVNHRYKFIFIRTRKVASTSIEIALSKYCNSNDILTVMNDGDGGEVRREMGYQMHCNFEGFHQHEPAQTAKEKLKDIWDSYFKFSVIRDPFEYLFSDYYWKNKTQEKSFEYFVKKSIQEKKNNWYIHTINDKPAMDFYVRYEHLTDDLNIVSEKLGLPGRLGDEVEQFNAKSQYRKNRYPAMSGEVEKSIRQAYKQELDLFDKLKTR